MSLDPQPLPDSDIRMQHSALTRGVGFADVSDRSQIEVTGKDRAQILHGLCTNDIKSLQPGEGCEAFLTNVQGKTIGYVYVFCGKDGLILESVSGESSTIIRSLDRYVIREDVKFHDRGNDWCEFLVSGPETIALLQGMLRDEVPSNPLHHATVEWQGAELSVRRVPFAGSVSFFLATQKSFAKPLERHLMTLGAVPCTAEAVEIARMEAGSPLFGKDVSGDNLPQEVGRTKQAISFTKGCYLGQETVARIDALGHVNRSLSGITFSKAGASVPQVGYEDRIEGGKVRFVVTSVCWSIRLEAPLALAYVRRGFDEVGNLFSTPGGEAEVVRLPLS